MPTKQRNQVLKGPHGGMQLVLLEDVTHLGKQGEVVEVSPAMAAIISFPAATPRSRPRTT